jgi:hypothetical protein
MITIDDDRQEWDMGIGHQLHCLSEVLVCIAIEFGGVHSE